MDRRYAPSLVLSWFVGCVAAQNNSTTVNDTYGYPFDPILQYRPPFARSVPVQILFTGIVFTLAAVLLIHLLFTAQYHWPLAPVNFTLQVSAVTTLVVSCVATIHVIMSTVSAQSREWPYMLDYIAVNIPPLTPEPNQFINGNWTTAGLAAWLLMNATVGMLIQLTHIQFLTLLYPSTLERRLIYALLGPLAVMSASMHIVRIRSDVKTTDVAFAIQNVCNATLSLLFTASLMGWGFLVNRKRAWRTDGGTANFGAGAITLAIMSTVTTFLYIPTKEQYEWMPGLIWAIILWQSFLGWWWWVGAGMGVGEVDDLLRREEKRRKKRSIQLARRQVRRERAQTILRGVSEAFGVRRRNTVHHSDGEDSTHAAPVPSARSASEPATERAPSPTTVSSSASTNTAPGTTASTTVSLSTRAGLARLFDHRAWHVLQGWFLYLRHAHLTAARAQAVEHVERINQVYGPDGQPPVGRGWGLRGFGLGLGTRGGRVSESVEMHSFSSKDSDGSTAEDVEEGVMRIRRRRSDGPQQGDAQPGGTAAPQPQRPRSLWWWGPLAQWRLQDTTVY
ncbi:hypothetical protein CERSUDRAFT_118356 [Gelatoporia subvermispora B]|uniref:Uncharacterized protein n=1 Tax=Ceriporiopsis subvermispora (strain B) TaxID=914234 RepID=M2R240_CERS8|nr:hypothetical protein CERSUDRAFT_118356 [Gelatoporia subvermispora B]